MPRHTTLILLPSLLTATLFAATAQLRADEPASLRIHGATTFATRLMEPHRALIEQRSGERLAVVPNKSIHGLTAVIQGRADLAMLSSSLDAHLRLFGKEIGRVPVDKLRSFEISRTTVAFVVHPSNPVTSLTLDQIRAILSGTIDNWRSLGGDDIAIKPIMVRDGGGVMLTVESQLLGGQSISAPNSARVDTARQVLKAVGQHAGGIGFAQTALAAETNLTRLQTDRPIEQILSLVSLGQPSPRAQRVIDATKSVAAERLF